MNRVGQSQGSTNHRAQNYHRQTDTQTHRHTEFPLVEGPHPKDVDLENVLFGKLPKIFYQLVAVFIEEMQNVDA